MSTVQSTLGAFAGRPETSDDPAISRAFARRWYWRTNDPDEYECPDCDRSIEDVHQFDVHHRDGDPTNNDPENLVGICHRCHVWRHHDGPTLSGLDVEEWKRGFESLGGDSTNHNTVYDHD